MKRPLLISLCFLIVTVGLSHLAIGTAFSLDTNYCQYLQGVLFSRGVIHGDATHFKGLSVHLTCMFDPFQTGYASKYPPGYSALIAMALPLRATTLINPICGAMTLLLTLLIVQRGYRDSGIFFWTVVLSFASIYFLHMSAESWNHPSALLACTVIVWAALQEPTRSRSSSLFIVLALIFCALTRPLSAVGMALFLLVVALQRRWNTSPDIVSSTRLITSATIGIVAGGVALGLYNHVLTGDFFTSGYEAMHGPPHNPGFHIDPYGRDFTLWAALMDLGSRWRSMNEWLFMWPIPSLTLLAIWAVVYKRWSRCDATLLLWIGAQSLIYCLMWSAGQVQFGPRFLYEALPACIILSARGMTTIEEMLGGTTKVRLLLLVSVGGLSTVGFIRYVEWLARFSS